MPFDSLHHQPGPVSDFSEPALPATESYMLAAPASATETPIVVLLSLTGQLLYVSSAATSVLRLNAADMAQRTIYEFMDLDDIDRFSAFLDTLVSCHDGIESKSTSLKLRDSSNNLIDFAIHGRNYYSSLPFHDPSCDPRSYWDIAASQLPAPGQASPEGMVLLCVAQPSYVHQYREYSEPRVISPNSKVMTLLQQPAVATAAASAVANVSADRSTQQPQHEQSPQQTHQQNLQSSQSHPQSHIQHAPEASSLWARRQLARSDPNDTTPVPPQRLTLFTNHINDPVPSSSPFEYPSSSTANGFSPRMADSRLTTPDHEQHLLVTPTTATYSVDSSTMWPPLSASSAVPSAAYPPVPNSATSSYSYLMSPTTAYHSSTSSLNEDHRNSVPSLYDQHMAPQQSPATAPYWQHTAETSPYFDSYDAQYQYQQQQQQQQYNWASSQQDARSYSLPATFSHQHRATVASPYGAPTAHGPIDLSTYKMSSKKPPRRRSRQYNDDGTPHICAECQVRESPEWRKGPKGAKTLCNACGLRWAKKARKEELQKKR